MESGGMLSHGSVVARECGVVCVVQVPNIMREVSNGDMIEIDGDTGVVKLFK